MPAHARFIPLIPASTSRKIHAVICVAAPIFDALTNLANPSRPRGSSTHLTGQRREVDMGSTGVLFGQVMIVFAIIAIGMWCGTQWTAAELGYQIRLGAPWFRIHEFPVYYPWRLWEWWYAYESYAPLVFNRGGAIVASSGLIAACTAIAGSILRARQAKRVTTYGSARWATPRDIKIAGLVQGSGIFLGRSGLDYLRHNGPEHVLAFAPTRSGKGVGLVVPTLLTWPSSVIVHDIKGENWQLTAGWRSRFSHCLLFDPTDARSAAY